MASSVAEDPLRLVEDEDTGGGGVEVQLRVADETFWATQAQMAEMFGVDRSTVSEHLSNIFASGELDETATCRKFRQVRIEGSQEVAREIPLYNLNALISVGYRVGSKQGTLAIGRLTLMAEAETLLEVQLRNLNRAVLRHGGSVSHETTEARAKAEYAKFDSARREQRRLTTQEALAAIRASDKQLPTPKRTRKKSDKD